jgi:hypothetical protein
MGHTGGFAANRELARTAGAKGGRISRRGREGWQNQPARARRVAESAGAGAKGGRISRRGREGWQNQPARVQKSAARGVLCFDSLRMAAFVPALLQLVHAAPADGSACETDLADRPTWI